MSTTHSILRRTGASALALGFLLVGGSAFAQTPEVKAACDNMVKLAAAEGETIAPEDQARCLAEMEQLASICGGDTGATMLTCLGEAKTVEGMEPCIMQCEMDPSAVPTPPEPPELKSAPPLEGEATLDAVCGRMAKMLPENQLGDCQAELGAVLKDCPTKKQESLTCLGKANSNEALLSCLMTCASEAMENEPQPVPPPQ